jgi:hypothetical protein
MPDINHRVAARASELKIRDDPRPRPDVDRDDHGCRHRSTSRGGETE